MNWDINSDEWSNMDDEAFENIIGNLKPNDYYF